MNPALAHLDTALVCALLGALGGWLVPRLIAAVPEPEPDPEPEPEPEPEPAREGDLESTTVDREPEPPKMLYAEVAARSGLAPKAAVAGGVAGALVGQAIGWEWSLTWVMVLVPVGVALAIIDWFTHLLPKKIVNPSFLVVIALVVVGAVLVDQPDSLVRVLLGWAAFGGFFALLWFVYPAGLGFGDVRLAGLLGIALGALGWAQLVTALEATVILGGIVGIGLLLAGRSRKAELPYGPYLLLGTLIGVVAGPAWFSVLGYT